MNFQHHPAIWFAPVTLVLLALFPLPYPYYVFLRIFMFVSCGFLAYQQWAEESIIDKWVLILCALAILYNPILRISLTREIWSVLNVLTAAAIIVHFLSARNRWRKDL